MYTIYMYNVYVILTLVDIKKKVLNPGRADCYNIYV